MYPAPANRLARPVEGTRLFRQGATFARFADACKRVFALPVSGAVLAWALRLACGSCGVPERLQERERSYAALRGRNAQRGS